MSFITPPIFTEMHATTIANAAKDKMDPHVLSVFQAMTIDPITGMLIFANVYHGDVIGWVVHSPLSFQDAVQKTLALGLSESDCTFLQLDQTTLVPLDPDKSH